MKRDKTNALVPRPGTDIAAPGRRTSPVIARMTRDVLARAQAQELSAARFRIGEYLLREPDYRQILQWAEMLGMSPETVLGHLSASRLDHKSWEDCEPIAFAVADGAILSLAWDFARLPLIPENWEDGLLIRYLGFLGRWPNGTIPLRPDLPRLQVLRLKRHGHPRKLEAIDVSRVPRLAELACALNRLTDLDLSPVPGLTKLWCQRNKLTELDLSPVPGLTSLDCGANKLTELDLSPVPGLTELDCAFNQLSEVDLSPVPGLTKLDCTGNKLTELDLSPVPELTWLDCDEDVRILSAPPDLNKYEVPF